MSRALRTEDEDPGNISLDPSLGVHLNIFDAYVALVSTVQVHGGGAVTT
jgi:hypothetical protein